MKKVLSTKTLDRETLAYAQTQNLDVQCEDFIETAAFPFKLESLSSKNFDALAFTSAAAVKYFFENKNAAAFAGGKQIFAIQGKTQDELLAKGIEVDITAANAQELATAIIKSGKAKDVLHISGNLRLPVLEEELFKGGILYTDLMVYQTGTKAKKIADNSFDAIMFYSPSGVESFLSKNQLNDNQICCCIGNTTAQALKEKNSTATIIVPGQPTPQSMLATVSKYFQDHSQS